MDPKAIGPAKAVAAAAFPDGVTVINFHGENAAAPASAVVELVGLWIATMG